MEFTRGDTYRFKFQRFNENGEVIEEKSQKMWFTVKKNYRTEEKLIQKTLENNEIKFDTEYFYHIVIEPNDTSNLNYGKYVYDIQVENDGVVSTIALGELTLTNEVTFEGGTE